MLTQYLFVAAKKAALWELQSDSAKLQVQTQFMDQSLAVMLRQLCYGKINFIVLVPGRPLASYTQIYQCSFKGELVVKVGQRES